MNKKLNFCTLFDSSYLHYGLSLHESLLKNCDDFQLYIFAFDEKCAEFLRKISLKNVTLISLNEFEDEKLLAVKPTRSKGEYCWTSTPSIIRYVLKNFAVEDCTYVDADIFFFANPKILLDEMGDKSVSIISHRYSASCDQSEKSGKYCVQFMTFKNNKSALEVLEWWRERCLEWCYNRVEDNKFGDQKYLDDWLTRFDNVCELQNLGAGVAPWNVEQYQFGYENNKIIGREKSGQKKFQLIFYHFHAFKLINRSALQLTARQYKIADDVFLNIYKPYLKVIEKSALCAYEASLFLQEIAQKKMGFFAKIKLLLFPLRKNILLRD